MIIFYVLNGLGIAFLLYVLAHFWNEGRQTKKDGGAYRRDLLRRDGPAVFVVTRPVSRNSQKAAGKRSVIAIELREREVRVPEDGMRAKQSVGRSSDMAEVISMKRVSTR